MLFLQALTLEAGAWTVLQGVGLGLAGVVAVVLPRRRARAEAAAQEDARRDRRSDHGGARRDGRQTVQTLQAVGWVPVTPVEGLDAALLVRPLARRSTRRGRGCRPGGRSLSSSSAATWPPNGCGHGAACGSSPRSRNERRPAGRPNNSQPWQPSSRRRGQPGRRDRSFADEAGTRAQRWRDASALRGVAFGSVVCDQFSDPGSVSSSAVNGLRRILIVRSFRPRLRSLLSA